MTNSTVHRSDLRPKSSNLNRCSILEEMEVLVRSDDGFCLVFLHSVASKCFDVSPKSGKISFFLRSWDCASLMYLSITNKMQRYTMIFITINALHVSGGFSAHHQELKTIYTASDICRAFTACSHKRQEAVKLRQIPDAVYTVLSS